MTNAASASVIAKVKPAQAFLNWFQGWGNDLWRIIHYGSSSQGEYSEDFIDRLTLLQKKIGRRQRKDPSGISATQFFLRYWKAQLEGTLGRQAQGDSSGKRNMALFLLVRLGWSRERVARVFRLSITALSFRIYQDLKNELEGDGKWLVGASRDCFRSDMYLADQLLGIGWSSPLKFSEQTQLAQHRKGCSRCLTTFAKSQEIFNGIKGLNAEPIPAKLDTWVRLEMSKERPLIGGGWLSSWPWYIKLPFQLGVVGTLVLSVAIIPYVGDLYPDWRKDLNVDQPSNPTVEKPLAVAAVPPPKIITPAVEKIVPTSASTQFYRWGAFSKSPYEDSKKILEQLEALGAKKAGNLALGASHLGGHYFHFLIDEDKYNSSFEAVKVMGLSQFVSNLSNSDRLSPSGKRRVVFLILPGDSL